MSTATYKQTTMALLGALVACLCAAAIAAPQQAFATESESTELLAASFMTAQEDLAAQASVAIPTRAKNYKGHAYCMYSKSVISWTAAKKACEKRGGHLATVTSQGEQDFIDNYIKGSNDSVWLGGYCKTNRVWHWITGENWKYENWKWGEPNADYNATENKLGTWPMYWNDFVVYDRNGSIDGYICEWDNIITDLKVTATSQKSLKATWSKQSGATNYQVQYRVKGGSWKSKTVKKNTVNLKNLKAGKKYQVRVRAYSKTGFQRAKGKVNHNGAWSRVKTAKTVKAKTGTKSGKLVYFKFNGNFKSSAGSVSTVHYGNSKFAAGKSGKAAYFDGDGDYVTVGKKLNLTKNYTLNVWVKPASGNETRSDAGIFAKYETNQYGPYDFYLSYNKPAFWMSNGNGGDVEVVSNTQLKNGKWYMLTYTYKASAKKLSLYINGKYDNSWAMEPLTSNSDVVTIGRQALMFDPYSHLEYRGWLDELALYNKSLTASQIKALYKKNR